MAAKVEAGAIRVGPVDPAKETSPINDTAPPRGGGMKAAYCWYNGQRFSDGSVVVQADGYTYICCDGQWWKK